MNLTRRDWAKLAMAAAVAKPNSNFDGVRIGAITYCYRDKPELANNAESLLKLIVDSNIGAIELMPPTAENFAGAPVPVGRAGAPGGSRGPGATAEGGCTTAPETPSGAARGSAGGRAAPTPEQLAAAEELKKWRLSASMDKFKAFRKMYNDAGVGIYCHKLSPNMNMSDEEYEYMFNVAEALGAKQVSLELSNDLAFTKRLGEFAAKRGMVAAYHGHTQASLTAWDAVLAQSTGNAVNLDCGHYVAGTGLSPIPALMKYGSAGRIANLHLKDRTTPAHCALNLPWGQGDTPIGEILRTMRKNKFTFPASVELEYRIPEGSTAVIEVKKCVDFCRKALA
jgi:sugar phosphate isomerase/epimerase